MKKRSKVFLFLFSTALFFIAAPLTVFYSLGWRVDWANKKITQPGVFYFKVLPRGAQIYINSQLKKKTDFFFGSALIKNLSPRKYNAEVKKDGFQSWKKTLDIKKGKVTEAKNILLFPADNEFNSLSENLEQVFLSPDGKKIISKELVTQQDKSQSWSLNLINSEKNIKSLLTGESDILTAVKKLSSQKKYSAVASAKKAELLDIKFSYDSKIILLKISLNKNIAYFTLDLEKTPRVVNFIDLPDFLVQDAFFNPKNTGKLLFQESGSLYEKDIDLNKVSQVSNKKILIFFVSSNYIYYLDESGIIFRNDPLFLTENALNENPFAIKKGAEYGIFASEPYIFLKENNALYQFANNEKRFNLLADKIKNLKFSPDNKKIAYCSDNEIYILYLEIVYDQPPKEAGDKTFLARFSEKIENVFWLNDHYLIFDSGGKIKISEIDDRDKVNIYDISDFKNPEIFWSKSYGKLFVFSEATLYSSEKLTP